MVLGNETRERLADNQADVQRQTGVSPRAAARAIEQNDKVRVLQNQVPGQGIGHHRFQAGEAYVPVDREEPARRFGQEHLAVAGIGKPELLKGGFIRRERLRGGSGVLPWTRFITIALRLCQTDVMFP